MNWLSFASIAVFSVSLTEGLYILALDFRKALNRRFFYMSLCIAVWLFGAAFAYSAAAREDVVFWFRVSSFGFIFLHAFTLHFVIGYAFPGLRHRLRQAVFLLYAPSFFFLYRSYTGLVVFSDFVPSGGLWTGVPDYESPVFLLLAANYLLYYAAASVLLILRWKRVAGRSEKRKTLIFFFSIAGTILFYNAEPFVLPLLTGENPFGIAPLFSLIWITGMGYAIVRYRFLTWSPSGFSSEIIENIDEAVVVFSPALRTVYINHAARIILEKSVKTFGRCETAFFDLFAATSGMNESVKKLTSGNIRNFSCRLHFAAVPSIMMDGHFSMIADRAGEISGIVFIGRPQKDPKRFLEGFSLSTKEQQVLRLLLQGKKNSDIAAVLGVSLRTVKSHAASIYRKMNVRNKVELFNLLKSYDLFPDTETEAMLFPLLEKKIAAR